MKLNKHIVLLCVALAAQTAAGATDYPTKAIKFVVPSSPGGGTDVK